VLVKVNSVMIPGVNDRHLREVSRVIKAKGAFLHNVMPLIAEQEHGTYYGIMGQRGPTQAELTALQDACGDMNMMRHCRQCRSDAVGLLGEDRGAEFAMHKIEPLEIDYAQAMQRRESVRQGIEAERARQRKALASYKGKTLFMLNGVAVDDEPRAPASGLRPVLMAVASSGHGLVNQHFGHAKEFLVYEASPAGARLVGHRKTEQYCAGGDTCGDAETALERTIRLLQGCEAVLCSKIGFEPWGALEKAGIAPNGEHAMEAIEDAVVAVYGEMAAAGKLAAPAPLLKRA
jgi:nitrogen fixation protein NifB